MRCRWIRSRQTETRYRSVRRPRQDTPHELPLREHRQRLTAREAQKPDAGAGLLVTGRRLAIAGNRYVPGQHEVKTLDPHPHRDRADLAAALTYVDDDGRACHILCIRYRDTGWRAIKVHRATLTKMERGTAVGCPPLEGELLAVVERAVECVEPFPWQAPSEDEKAMRRLAHKLIDSVSA